MVGSCQRIRKQAETATKLALWLNDIVEASKKGQDFGGVPAGVFDNVWHARLQGGHGGFDAFKSGQLTDGPACFSVKFSNAFYATWWPHSLEYFVVSCRRATNQFPIHQLKHQAACHFSWWSRISCGTAYYDRCKGRSDSRSVLSCLPFALSFFFLSQLQ